MAEKKANLARPEEEKKQVKKVVKYIINTNNSRSHQPLLDHIVTIDKSIAQTTAKGKGNLMWYSVST